MPAGSRPITPCCSRPRRPRTTRLVFGETEPEPATLARLGAFGFRDPARAWETVQGWHLGRRPALRTGRAREILAEMLPALLRALGGTADPDGALLALDRAFARMPALAELLAILRSHERLRLLFADILGTAPRLADTVGLSPHVLDTVLDADFVTPTTDPDAVARPVPGAGGRAGQPRGRSSTAAGTPRGR